MSYLYVKWNNLGRGLLASALAIKACRAAARGIRWALSQRVAFGMLLAPLFGLLVARFPGAVSLGVWE